jgi:hypothetical protein
LLQIPAKGRFLLRRQLSLLPPLGCFQTGFERQVRIFEPRRDIVLMLVCYESEHVVREIVGTLGRIILIRCYLVEVSNYWQSQGT